MGKDVLSGAEDLSAIVPPHALQVWRWTELKTVCVCRRSKQEKLFFAIDRGGTFTDIFCQHGENQHVLKLLSVDPAYPV